MSATDISGALRQAETALGVLAQAPPPPGSDPERAVESFLDACRAVEGMGAPALGTLTALLASPNPMDFSRGQVAARMLAELSDPDVARALLEVALSDDTTASFRAWFALRGLRRSPAHFAVIAGAAMEGKTAEAGESQRDRLADSLARQLTPDQYANVVSWASSHPRAYVRQAIFKALARWGGPGAVPHLRAALANRDPSVSSWAAFGLLFEVDAPDAIRVVLAGKKARRAEARAEVVSLLGWLPWPGAVPEVIASMEDSASAVSLAAISGAGHAGVRPCVLALAEHLDDERAPVAEQAAAVLRGLLGRDPGYEWKGRQLTPASVSRVRQVCREVHARWAPGERHLQGAVASPEQYARALASAGATSAFWSLVGMAGERFGYDPAADVIANWQPLQRWRAWASTSGGAIQPGAFYLRGQPLDASALA